MPVLAHNEAQFQRTQPESLIVGLWEPYGYFVWHAF